MVFTGVLVVESLCTRMHSFLLEKRGGEKAGEDEKQEVASDLSKLATQISMATLLEIFSRFFSE